MSIHINIWPVQCLKHRHGDVSDIEKDSSLQTGLFRPVLDCCANTGFKKVRVLCSHVRGTCACLQYFSDEITKHLHEVCLFNQGESFMDRDGEPSSGDREEECGRLVAHTHQNTPRAVKSSFMAITLNEFSICSFMGPVVTLYVSQDT